MLNQIDINRIYYFVKIVEAGNITRASESLNLAKTKLSRELSLLEEELGVQLVYRTTRQFKLTDAGLSFYKKVKENIEGLTQSVSILKNQDDSFTGKLTVTAPDDLGVYLVTKIIDEFSKLHPKLEFEIIYSNEILDIVKNGIDVAIRIGHLRDSTLIQKRAGNIEFILVTSPQYLRGVNPISDIEALKNYQTIGFLNRDWTLFNKTRKEKIKLKHTKNFNNFFAIRDLVIAGHGISYLPRFICEEFLKTGEMVHILKQWGDYGPPIQVAIPQQKNIPKKVRAFMDFSTKKIGDFFKK